MSGDSVWSPHSSGPNPLRKMRGARPRVARVTFTLSRVSIALSVVGGLAALSGAFLGGFAAGFRAGERHTAEEASAFDPLPEHFEPRGVRTRIAHPTAGDVAARELAVASGRTSTGAPSGTRSGTRSSGRGEAPLPGAESSSSRAELKARAPSSALGVELRLAVGPLPAGLRGFGIQTGAFPTIEDARASLEPHRPALAKVRVFIVPVEIKGRGVWYRVRIGVYPSRDAAEAARRALPESLTGGAMVVGYK